MECSSAGNLEWTWTASLLVSPSCFHFCKRMSASEMMVLEKVRNFGLT